MKTLSKATIAIILLAATMGLAKDKQINPKLQAVKVVYVDGKDTEALQLTKQRLEHRTCFRLTENKSEADAILKVDQGPTRPEEGVSKTNVGMTLVAPDEGFIWEGSHTGVEFTHTGVDDAVRHDLFHLAGDACAGYLPCDHFGIGDSISSCR
jgi:hypothetical protein